MNLRVKLPFDNATKHRPIQVKNQSLMQLSKDLIKIRSRIFKILDEQFHHINLVAQKHIQIEKFTKDEGMKSGVVINESRLEEWVQMFRHQILTIREGDKSQQKELYSGDTISNIVRFPKPHKEETSNKILCHIDENTLNLYEHNPSATTDRQIWRHNPYSFPQGVIKGHSSITPISRLSQVILIGGSKPTNPNIKSSKIISLNLSTSSLETIANLPYGLSSHCAVHYQLTNSIYIIGGNKNHSIVSRGCFKFSLNSKKIQQISCLNYPVSSATCLIWKQQWIYKFGGVGQAFGEWNTSPYIERYSIQLNQWEVINPCIGPNVNHDLPLNNMFLAHSAAYVCENIDNIFVFGGYSIDGEFKNCGFLLRIQEFTRQHQGDRREDDNIERHVIEEYGQVESGNTGQMINKIVFAQNSLQQSCLYGLVRYKETGKIKPDIIHNFNL